MTVPAANKKQLSKIQRQKLGLRDNLWRGLKESRLWHYQKSDGWLNIPRALPLILQIMDRLSKGKPVSTTYFDLWCRTYNDSFVIANKPREMAFFAGFTGERAERTWSSRMRILADLGFIEIKGGPSGSISYVLLLNPYAVVKDLHEKKRVDDNTYNALIERMMEIRADDLQAVEVAEEEEEEEEEESTPKSTVAKASKLKGLKALKRPA